MTRAKKKGPVVTIDGMQVRGLPNETLALMKDQWSQEVLFWRNEVTDRDRALAVKQTELDKAEATIRNQDVELRRLRRRIAELESGPADEIRTRTGLIESQGS